MEVNGITYRPKWFARKIWVGDGASPPMDFIEGRSLIQLEKIKYGTEPIVSYILLRIFFAFTVTV